MGEDGMWMATYVEPVFNVMLGASGETAMVNYVASSQNVTLGTSGTTVMLTKAEDGSYWLGDMTVTSGETAATAITATRGS
jgi:hypothetical protein